MKLVILTPFFLPVKNGMVYATLSHIELYKRMNLLSEIFVITQRGSRFFQTEVSPTGNSMIHTQVSLLHIFKQIRGTTHLVLEGRNHPLHFLFTISMIDGSKIFFSHGSTIICGQGFIPFFKGSLRSVAYLLPNLMLFKGKISRFVLAEHADLHRFRDVLSYRILALTYNVVPNFSLNNVKDVKIVRSKDFLMVCTPDRNKGALEIVRHWTTNNLGYKLDIYFPFHNDYVSQIQSIVQKEEASNIKLFIGFGREEITLQLKEYRILIVNSITECQSLSVIDAIANGVNIMTTKTGKYSLEDEKKFIYFDRDSSRSLDDAITKSNSLPNRLVSRINNNYDSSKYEKHFIL